MCAVRIDGIDFAVGLEGDASDGGLWLKGWGIVCLTGLFLGLIGVDALNGLAGFIANDVVSVFVEGCFDNSFG